MARKKIKDDITEFAVASSLIEDERARQCNKGFGREHDKQHTDGSLLRCAMDICVGVAADSDGNVGDAPAWVQDRVEHVNKKYANAPIKRLVIAAALIAAGIERRQRVELDKRPPMKLKRR